MILWSDKVVGYVNSSSHRTNGTAKKRPKTTVKSKTSIAIQREGMIIRALSVVPKKTSGSIFKKRFTGSMEIKGKAANHKNSIKTIKLMVWTIR